RTARVESIDALVKRIGAFVLVAQLRQRPQRKQAAAIVRVSRDGRGPLLLEPTLVTRLDGALRFADDAPSVARVGRSRRRGRGGHRDREYEWNHWILRRVVWVGQHAGV